MTSIDFHVLPVQARRQHDVCVCELVEKHWQAGRAIYVHCADEETARGFDELLWTFHDTSFVPHALSQSPQATSANVLIGWTPHTPQAVDVLVNLDTQVPGFFSQFERVVETAGHDDPSRQLARTRYRFYKDRGYQLATHNG